MSACAHVPLQFNPNYKTYVLYSDGGPSENVKRKKFRAGAGKSVKQHRKRLSVSGQGVVGSEGTQQKRAQRLGSTGSGRRPGGSAPGTQAARVAGSTQHITFSGVLTAVGGT